jgi:glycosyltransferase involved in cell wall biosynthesis
MLVAAQMLGYGINRFLPDCLSHVLPHVDKLFVGYSSRPFSYNKRVRETETNPTPRESFTALSLESRIEIIDGDWATEEDARNACLDAARRQGFDWLLVIDADEFYTEQCWEQLLRSLRASAQRDHIITTWFNFFKSSHYVLVERDGSIKSTNAGFALRCTSNIRFRHRRLTTAERSQVIDCPCHHYGYVMSDAEMRQKISTWSHAADFNRERWYRLKWLNWTLDTRNLHPVVPTAWRKAVRFPLPQPEFAHRYAIESSSPQPLPLGIRLENSAYDLCAETLSLARSIKAAVRAS